ncbi:cobalt-precorrin-6A reductase [Asaia astilbis]
MKILILGGTSEARQLCQALESLHQHHIIFSLAGVTSSALPVPCKTRSGGFGGVSGLSTFLRAEAIDAVIDATHPFASQMSHHAVEAARHCDIPLLRLTRPAWQAPAGASWQHVSNMTDVSEALGPTPHTVFLSTGRKDLAPFFDTPHRYVLRSIERPSGSLPPQTTLILARGPFTLEDETNLLRHHGITCLVTKNAGAKETAAKLDAANQLNIPVIMVDRPTLPDARECQTIDAALDWIQGIRRSV